MEIVRTNWNILGTGRRAGVLVPLFSVHSKRSAGLGDFHDLKLLIDWCAVTGNTILQLLPMNETGADFCPYDAVSSFALEPAYAVVDDEKLRRKFPCSSGRVDYRVKDEKLRILRKIFLEQSRDEDQGFITFKKDNDYWLRDFALYKTIKKQCDNRPWYEWEDGLKNRAPAAVEEFAAAHQEDIGFEAWLQWQLHRQFSEAVRYAREKGVFIMGDLPILVARDSADVWAHRGYFKLEYAAGAPPDMYCAKGQRWGMPTYRWEAIAADGYRYIKEKLRYAENFYDLLRIDHVVGIFRIWSIPYDDDPLNEGLNGRFDPPDEPLWEEHGRKIIATMAESTRMLLCAEDLGVVPVACPKVLAETSVPGTEVQRWVKDWTGTRDFLPPERYREMAVATLSTHDTTNWAVWWRYEADPKEKENLWKLLGLSGRIKEIADRATIESALALTLSSKSIFCIHNILDWLALAGRLKGNLRRYRFNTPGTISNRNWSLRLPVSLEELADHDISTVIRDMINSSGRGGPSCPTK